jgi:DNA phosphorothioation-dependent restriction protein DptH
MDDICEMLVAKPVIGIVVSSAAGQNNACNAGILEWGREHFSPDSDQGINASLHGASEIHVFDERSESARPGDAEISNLAEDTANAVQWYAGADATGSHDLAIIAQLETSNADARPTKLTSPLGIGGLVRYRVREQQLAGNGQFLRESRTAGPVRTTGDGLADNTASAIGALEGLSESPMGYVFAPSINAVKKSLDKAEFAAVSSSSVDPACFLGHWLEGTYLWDYELPSYSGRSGDSNGYYLLSRIKPLDLETMKIVLQRLPGCTDLSHDGLSSIVQEVARRGIPTVRGLSAGNSGATGDLGLFVATRLLQDSFRTSGGESGLLRSWGENEGEHQITLLIPVDPFQRYLDDLAKAIKRPTLHRPDLIVVGLNISDSSVRCKLTPIEVKNRSGSASMPHAERLSALEQAKSLSSLLLALRQAFSDDGELLIWRLAYQNLLCSMIGYGFRVYSQHLAEGGKAADWAGLHSRVMDAILSLEIDLEIDDKGRLIVVDGSSVSGPRDTDSDGFKETIELSQSDASMIVRGRTDELYHSMTGALGHWALLPRDTKVWHSHEIKSKPEYRPPEPEPLMSVRDDTRIVSADAVSPANPVQPDPAISLPANHDGSEQSGLILRIGETLDGFQSRVRHLNLGQTSLNQLNMGVVGDLGTGKTQLLQSIIFQIATGATGNRGVAPSILIFDYKKDYSSAEFVQATGARVIRPQHIPLNLFDLSNSSQSISPWLDRYRFFSDAIEKIYSGIGAVQREKLKNAIKEAYRARLDGSYPTIYDVFANYQDALKGGSDSITGILGDMVDMELFATDPESIAKSGDFLKGVVVIALNELGQDDRTKNMLVAILLNVFYEHMLKIPKRPFLGRDRNMRVVDSMLLVDEADNIMKYEFDVLRKFRRPPAFE